MRALFIVGILVALVVPVAAQNNQSQLEKLMQQKNQAKINEIMKNLTQTEYRVLALTFPPPTVSSWTTAR